MDGLEDEPFEVDVISTEQMEPEIKTIIVERPVEVIKEVIKEVPVEVIKVVEVIKEVPVESGISDIVNQSASTIGGKRGPLYAFRTNTSARADDDLDDDKNRDAHFD